MLKPQLYLKDSMRPDPITDAQVKARYDEIVVSLGKDEYKQRIIAVADDATAASVLSQLKARATSMSWRVSTVSRRPRLQVANCRGSASRCPLWRGKRKACRCLSHRR